MDSIDSALCDDPIMLWAFIMCEDQKITELLSYKIIHVICYVLLINPYLSTKAEEFQYINLWFLGLFFDRDAAVE